VNVSVTAQPVVAGDADQIRAQLAEEKKELQALVEDLGKAILDKDNKLSSLGEEKEQVKEAYDLRLSEKEIELENVNKENELYVMQLKDQIGAMEGKLKEYKTTGDVRNKELIAEHEKEI